MFLAVVALALSAEPLRLDVTVEAAEPDGQFAPRPVTPQGGRLRLASCGRLRLFVSATRPVWLYAAYFDEGSPSEMVPLLPTPGEAPQRVAPGSRVLLPEQWGDAERFFYLDAEPGTEVLFLIGSDEVLDAERTRAAALAASGGPATPTPQAAETPPAAAPARKAEARRAKKENAPAPPPRRETEGAGSSALLGSFLPDAQTLDIPGGMKGLAGAWKGMAVGQASYPEAGATRVEAEAGDLAVYALEIEHVAGAAACPAAWR